MTKEAFAQVREKYFPSPTAPIQKSGMMPHHAEQTQTYSAAKDPPEFRDGPRLDQALSSALVEAPTAILHTLAEHEYWHLAEMYSQQHYRWKQVEVYDEDRISFARFVTNAKALESQAHHDLPTLLKAHEEAIQITAQSLHEHHGLAQELAHIAPLFMIMSCSIRLD